MDLEKDTIWPKTALRQYICVHQLNVFSGKLAGYITDYVSARSEA